MRGRCAGSAPAGPALRGSWGEVGERGSVTPQEGMGESQLERIWVEDAFSWVQVGREQTFLNSALFLRRS